MAFLKLPVSIKTKRSMAVIKNKKNKQKKPYFWESPELFNACLLVYQQAHESFMLNQFPCLTFLHLKGPSSKILK